MNCVYLKERATRQYSVTQPQIVPFDELRRHHIVRLLGEEDQITNDVVRVTPLHPSVHTFGS
jgi:hypothetical protein